MEGRFIDRDPHQMIRYAQEADVLVAQMEGLVRRVREMLNAYAPKLDTLSQKDIEKLNACCDDFNRQITCYRVAAQMVQQKAKATLFAREGR